MLSFHRLVAVTPESSESKAMQSEPHPRILDEAEVAIVGGGIMGCASAYQLALDGKSVVLLERDTIGGQASVATGAE